MMAGSERLPRRSDLADFASFCVSLDTGFELTCLFWMLDCGVEEAVTFGFSDV